MEKNAVLVTNRQLPKTILTKLNELRREGTWCDLRLQVSSSPTATSASSPADAPVVFPVHGCIVAAASDVFALMVEKNVKHAILSDVDSYPFSLCLNFIYGSKIFVPLDDIPAVINCAERLHLSGLVEICQNSLKVATKVTDEDKDQQYDDDSNKGGEEEESEDTEHPVLRKQDSPTQHKVRAVKKVNLTPLRRSARRRKPTRKAICQSQDRMKRKPSKVIAPVYDSDAGAFAGEVSDAHEDPEYPTTCPSSDPEPEHTGHHSDDSLSTVSTGNERGSRRRVSSRKRSSATAVGLKAEPCAIDAPQAEDLLSESLRTIKEEQDLLPHEIQQLTEAIDEVPALISNNAADDVGIADESETALYKEESMDTSCAKSSTQTPFSTDYHADLPSESESLSATVSPKSKRLKTGKLKRLTKRKRKYKTKLTLNDWLKKNSKKLSDFRFDDLAEKLGVPEEIRPLLEYDQWPEYLHSGKFRGTPRMAYAAYYTNTFKEFTCETCGLEFTGMIKYRQHRQKEHTNRVYCSFCARPFTTVGNLKMHETRHKATEKNIKCDLCDFVCYFKGELSQHKRRRHRDVVGRETFLCSKCAFTCESEPYLRAHEQRVHNKDEWKKANPKHKCNLCNYVGFKQKDVERHKRNKHSTLKPFVCEICRRSAFKQRSQLYVHIRKVHGQEPEKCKVKTIENMFDREEPKTVELLPPLPKPEVTYQCEYCEYKTTISRNLKSHMIIHSEERPFQCKFCSEAFKRRDVLVRHTRRHHKVDMRSAPRYHYVATDDGQRRRMEGEQIIFIQHGAYEPENQMYITQVDAPDSEYFPFIAPS